MKRSEMVQIIMNRLYGAEGMKSSEAICSYILRGIEDSGMLPPTKNGLIKCEETEAGEIVIPIWSWEPEDKLQLTNDDNNGKVVPYSEADINNFLEANEDLMDDLTKEKK